MRRKTEVWHVYVLRCADCDPLESFGQGDRSYYVGISNNVSKRVKEHNDGQSRSTRGRQWEIAALLECASQHQAAIVERWMKTGDSRDKRLELVNLYDRNEVHGEYAMSFIGRACTWWTRKQVREEVEKVV